MDALVALRQDGLDPQQKSALGSPVAGTAGAVFLAGDYQQGRPFALVAHASLEDAHALAGFDAPGTGRQVHRDAAFGAGNKLIAQPDVGKRAAHHDFVIAAPGAEGIEVLGFDALFDQVAAGGAARRNGAGRRDVVRGYGIAEHRQHARAGDAGYRRHRGRQVGEEGRLLHVGRGSVPGVQFPFRHGEPGPGVAALKDGVVSGLEQFRAQRLLHGGADFGLRGPHVAEINGVAEGVVAERLGLRLEIHRAGQRVGHHQRRRGQIVRLGRGVHAPLEIPVAAQDGGGHQVIVCNGVVDAFQDGAAVADAGGAAVADSVESQGLQVRGQARRLQVSRDHPRPRRQAGLHVRRHPQAAFDGFLGQQAGADHDGGVGGIGATRDGRDDDRAVRNRGRLAARLDRHPVAAVEVAALIHRLLPCRRCFRVTVKPPLVVRCGIDVHLRVVAGRQRLPEGTARLTQRHAVLGALGAGNARLDSAQVQVNRVAEVGLRAVVGAEQALLLGVPLDEFHVARAASAGSQESQGFLIYGEETDGGAVFGRHVGNGGAVRQTQLADAGTVVLDELVDHPFGAQQLRHGEHQVRCGGAFRQLAAQLDPDNLRRQHVERLPQHDRLGLDAADPPADNAQPVDHRRMGIRADQ